ncbi:MAG: DNA recombination protein RmuC [Pseudomonadota bacterium]
MTALAEPIAIAPVWLAIGAAVFAVALVALIMRLRETSLRLADARIDLAAAGAALDQARSDAGVAAVAHAAADSRAQLAEDARDQIKTDYAQAVAAAAAAQRAEAAAVAEVKAVRAQMAEWEKMKAEWSNGAKAAALNAAGALSNKLLDDHKRETEAAKLEAEKRVRAATEGITQRFEAVSETLAALRAQVGEARDGFDLVRRAVSTPAGVGRFAEVGLERTLRDFGLEAGVDFEIQPVIDGEDGRQQRPDAVVFLPNDWTIAIDAKASMHVMAAAAAEAQGDDPATSMADLAREMRKRRKSLATKAYGEALAKLCRSAGRETLPGRVMTVMYLPTDGALERVRLADPTFQRDADAAGITPVGPSGLAAMLSSCRLQIDEERRGRRHHEIMAGVSDLMKATILALSHADRIGQGLNVASDGYAKLRRAVGQSVFRSMRQLGDFGVRPAGDRAVPDGLKALSAGGDDDASVEGEAPPRLLAGAPR